MAIGSAIRNPLEWSVDQVASASQAVGTASRSLRPAATRETAPPAVRRIALSDIRAALAQALDDFGAYRTDIIFLCLLYPIAGLVLARIAFDQDLLPLLFPLASGFALVGPVAAVGMFEMSRRRELGAELTWKDSFGVLRSPAFGAILALSLILMAIFLLWLAAAYAIYTLTLGPEPPASLGAFAEDVFTTGAGWAMIAIGIGVGFLFAVLVLAISVVSFPLLLDRNVSLYTALGASVRAVAANPAPMAAWGLIVAGALAIGSIPLFLGLIIVMPVLGHATWHLYRRLVPA